MREIKFRGKDTTGIWRYGGIYGTVQPHIIHSIAGYETRAFTQVDPETVGQFTGLYDAEDNEIYEGDFIQSFIKNTVHEELIYKVEWQTDCWVGVDKFDVGFLLGNLLDAALFEVIGNIHDNPELLEKK